MVKANHLDACLIENECPGTAVRMGHGKHTRVVSSSASSVASSTGSSTNPLADWSTITCSSSENTCSDLVDKHWHSNKHDLIHAKLASVPNSVLTTSSSSSLSESFEDEEQIKLLCGDDDDEDHNDWPEVDTGRKRAHDNGRSSSSSSGQYSTRRRRFFPKLVKLLHKFRRKLNWQLFLFVAVLLVVFLSMSQLNEYQYRVCECIM